MKKKVDEACDLQRDINLNTTAIIETGSTYYLHDEELQNTFKKVAIQGDAKPTFLRVNIFEDHLDIVAN